MITLTVAQAKNRLYNLLDLVAQSHEPIQITGKRHNAVLVSEEDWRSIKQNSKTLLTTSCNYLS